MFGIKRAYAYMKRLFLTEYIEIKEMTAPGTPGADLMRIYCAVDGTTSKLYLKDQAGSVTCLTDVPTGGALAAVTGITFTAAAGGITLPSDGAADDLTIAVTGATNSSLVLASAGTGADALQVTASAGGIDITSTGADIDIVSTNKSVNLLATEAAADQILISAAGTVAGNAVNITTTNGGILLDANGAVNGDITLDAADVIALITPDPITISGGTSSLVFDGATAGTNTTTLAVTDPTGARTVTIPDATGTVRLRGAATHDYGAAATTWTLSVAEQECSFLSASNANGAVIAQTAAAPGMVWLVYNGTGQVLTFKVTGQTGATLANGKYGLYACHATDIVEIWEQS
jgi:hypothetical protein